MAPTAGKVAVIGATGGVGRLAVKHALRKGHAVVALARNEEKLVASIGREDFDRLDKCVIGSCGDATALESAIAGADFVLSCLGTARGEDQVVESGTRNIVAAMKKLGVKNLAMISSIGVGDSLDQGKRNAWVFMYVVKPLFLRRVFQDLEGAEEVCRGEGGGLNVVRVRPPGLTDQPGKGSYQWVEPHVLKLPGGATPSIPREDVALAMVDLCEGDGFATRGGTGPSIYPMGL